VGLKQLQHLLLQGSFVRDVTPLSGLTELIELRLGNEASRSTLGTPPCAPGNSISDVRPLAGLTKLTILSLNCNSVNDLRPLSGLTSLSQLFLQFNLSINDIRPLVANPGLAAGDTIDLRANNLSSANCPDIKILIGRGAEVNFSPQRNNQTLTCP
jgi:internalin A